MYVFDVCECVLSPILSHSRVILVPISLSKPHCDHSHPISLCVSTSVVIVIVVYREFCLSTLQVVDIYSADLHTGTLITSPHIYISVHTDLFRQKLQST